MAGLASIHILTLELIHGLERGDSVLRVVKNTYPLLDIDLALELSQLIAQFEQEGTFNRTVQNSLSIYRDGLLQLIYSSLKGEPILKKLLELEKEIDLACEENVDEFILSLPTKVMLPVLLMQFPAFLLLLIGPVLNQFLKELSL